MPHRRRQHRHSTEIEELVAIIRNRFDGTPLIQIGKSLENFLLEAQEAVRASSAPEEQLKTVARYIEAVLSQIPESFKSRFLFDAALIQTIAESWSLGGARINDTIIPFYGKAWAHLTIPLHAVYGTPVRPLDVIHFPSRDDVRSIDLLDYPWLLHELGHNLFFNNGTKFLEEFQGELERVLRSATLTGIADRGLAKSKSIRALDDLRSYWAPTADHANWTHELAIDLVGVAAGGPAYIAAFEDLVSDEKIDPYLIGPVHPPYAVRAQAIIQGGESLGWGSYLEGLKILLEDWKESAWAEGRMNRYHYLANDDLLAVTCRLTLAMYDSLHLPRCSIRDVTAAENCYREGEIPDWGIPTLLVAHVVHESDPTGYDTWERNTIEHLVSAVTA